MFITFKENTCKGHGPIRSDLAFFEKEPNGTCRNEKIQSTKLKIFMVWVNMKLDKGEQKKTEDTAKRGKDVTQDHSRRKPQQTQEAVKQ